MIRSGGGNSKRSDPVRIGVVGAGRWGRVHALTLAAMGEAELVGLVEPRKQSLAAILPQLPGVRVWSDLDKALKECDADAWIVATTTATHVPVTRAILQSGKPVLLEKPICDDLAEARSLAPLVKPDSSNLMLGHVMLFNTEVRQLLTQQRAHKGRITLISAVRHRSTELVRLYHGENPLFLVMVHDMYVAQALMSGRGDPAHFSARVHHDQDGHPDIAAAIVQWNDGAIASLVASHITPPAMPLEGFDRMEVFGEGWCSRIDTSPRPIEVWEERYVRPLSLEINEAQPDSTGMLAEELRCFCRVVRGLEPVPAGATYQDAMQVEAWLQKLDAASKGA